jgi:hypothetical protein
MKPLKIGETMTRQELKSVLIAFAMTILGALIFLGCTYLVLHIL